MVVIRLTRSGQKGTPVYKLHVAHKAAKLQGRFIEKLGTLRLTGEGATAKKDAPTSERYVLEVNAERYQHWLKLGAIPSPRVAKVMKDFKVVVPAAAVAKSAEEKAEKKAKPASEEKKTPAKSAASKKAAPAKKKKA